MCALSSNLDVLYKERMNKMQLLILILKQIDLIDKILQQLAEEGIKGGTILEGSGMAKSLRDLHDTPMFGMLRHLAEEDGFEESKVMMFVLDDNRAVVARNTIKKAVDLRAANTGIMFSVPITYVEGLGEN